MGDFGYADDRLKNYDQIWNQWQSQVEPLTSRKAYMVGPGNHEASCHSIGNVSGHKPESWHRRVHVCGQCSSSPRPTSNRTERAWRRECFEGVRTADKKKLGTP